MRPRSYEYIRNGCQCAELKLRHFNHYAFGYERQALLGKCEHKFNDRRRGKRDMARKLKRIYYDFSVGEIARRP